MMEKKYKREYYEININKYKEKVICECGCEISKNNLTKHKKSNKHLTLINNKQS